MGKLGQLCTKAGEVDFGFIPADSDIALDALTLHLAAFQHGLTHLNLYYKRFKPLIAVGQHPNPLFILN